LTATVAVVTGAARGTGRACIDAVLPLVDVVLGVDLDAPAIDGTLVVACDVADPAAVSSLVDQVEAAGPMHGARHHP
jgi:NAD(P)-dependent dehydrogenase (short-subunit alcohol dehydrogenase family)